MTRIYYNPKQIHQPDSFSKSPLKPRLLAEALSNNSTLEFISDFSKLKLTEAMLAHDHLHAANLFNCRKPDGFGNMNPDHMKAIRYTNGNFLAAAVDAFESKQNTISLTSGFHHATWDFCSNFCTFNALNIAAEMLHTWYQKKTRILIIDEDAHYGNGCTDIIQRRKQHAYCHYIQSIFTHNHVKPDLVAFKKELEVTIDDFRPTLIMYQAGADNWINDPLGGSLRRSEMRVRDKIVKDLGIPTVVNLAGGYARNYDDTLGIHLSTIGIFQ